jgi:hypothetical protein
MKTSIPPVIITFALVCFALVQNTQAVNPPPDGGYPGGNTALGQSALFSLMSGTYNTGIGFFSLRTLTDSSFNTGVGAGTLLMNTADNNTATGAGALLSNTTGHDNTANGTLTLFSNTTGFGNTAVGWRALFSNTTGVGNTAMGGGTLATNIDGDTNTAIGTGAGSDLITGSNNIYIGDIGAGSESNVIAIGNVPSTGTPYEAFYVGAVFGVTPGSGNTAPVIVDDQGQLGTAPSAARFKKEIRPIDKASESVLALLPVTFRYKSDKTNTPQFGLVAEEVAKVNPELVVRDKNGEIFSVRYDAVNTMLLNGSLKEHGKNEEQEKTIAELKSGMTALAATVKEQAAQIQKVSAQLEASKPALQMVAK